MKLYHLISVLLIIAIGCSSNDSDKCPPNEPHENYTPIDVSWPRNKEYYSIQICQVPLEDEDRAWEIYDSLKSNYIVYFYKDFVALETGDRTREIKVNVGCYNSQTEAEEDLNEHQIFEGYEPKVDTMDMFVSTLHDEFEIIKVPQAIWKRDENSVKEIFRFEYMGGGEHTNKHHEALPYISPDGQYIVFYYYDGYPYIIKVNLETAGLTILVERSDIGTSFWDSKPRWSHDQQYIAFLEDDAWDISSGFWVVKADGSELTRLIDSSLYSMGVKSFTWHPDKNELIVFEATGLYGELYSCDLEGNKTALVEINIEERTAPMEWFSVTEDRILYKVIRMDGSGGAICISNQIIDLP